METVDPVVEQIRDASRRLAREWGFMRSTLAGSDLPPSAVHALIELDRAAPLTAARLAEVLNLEKSSVSRMLAKLVARSEIEERPSPDDGREKLLVLTARGRSTVAAIHDFAGAQVQAALERVPVGLRGQVVTGLDTYSRALAACRSGADDGRAEGVVLRCGYVPGAVGRVTEMHGRYYAERAGFGQYFESKVAAELAEFVSRLDDPDVGLWLAMAGDRVVGSVAVDAEGAVPRTGHLRWFIVDDEVRGAGLGRRLLAEATRHCDERGLASTYLWTLRGLDAARHLYEWAGFRLAEELRGSQWGKEAVEQRFVRPGPGAPDATRSEAPPRRSRSRAASGRA